MNKLIGLVVLVMVALVGCNDVDILIWDEDPAYVNCHWMPEFGENAICQEYTIDKDGDVDWGDILTDRKVDPEYMHAWLEFQKAEGKYLPTSQRR